MQGKKETIYTLLMGGAKDTWQKAVGNKLGILDNGIYKRVRVTNTIYFIIKEEVPKVHTVTNKTFLCD